MKRGRTRPLTLHSLSMLLLGLLVLLRLTLLPALGQKTPKAETQKPWTGKLKDGRVITKADLDRILQAHALWLKSEGKEGQQAELSDTDLSGAVLALANLSGADLNRAFLDGANLSGAWLAYVNLSGACLREANLSGACLIMPT